MTTTAIRPAAGAAPTRAGLPVWRTVVLDDPVNLMDYVTSVFRRHFGYPLARCEALMMRVHTEGRAEVSRGQRERMEADVVALHGYGLHATLEPVGADE
ncbi:ATP-dependent Clp protease adapter ClpS [Actinomyces sp. B33]|uniref:ATP-dependent Clp protease adapter ClpS n=1 Tax=Actinomyces sp. B33 TaxID=2942131 RepID=UPI002341A74C|nr:ATP-dependent Clp protease adapter ClpS [Actinomyces sp. B33]MDC4233851.1 ATP-dependent Clp protease adapter ClpS [Actinomyces sp. B33]